MPRVSHQFVVDRPIGAVFEGVLRISYELATAGPQSTHFRRDLDFPELGPQVTAAMEEQSAAGVVNLGRLVERELSGTAGRT
jgi:hypothetical protein